jgi:GNAT superfamily N-acetyltransferase
MKISQVDGRPARPNVRIGQCYDVIEFAENEPFPAEVRGQVLALFEDAYFDYHYGDGLVRDDRVRFVAVDRGLVLGHAAFEQHGRYAHIVSLAVHPDQRGRGVGAALERFRCARIRQRGLAGYMSCLCEDRWSQTFKSTLGFHPVNVKYGRPHAMTMPGKFSSSLNFTEGPTAPTPAGAEVVQGHDRYPEIRVLSDSGDALDRLSPPVDAYVEILAGPTLAVHLARDSRYYYTGVEMNLARNSWHHCFQLRNKCFSEGLAASPYLSPGWARRRQTMLHDLLCSAV